MSTYGNLLAILWPESILDIASLAILVVDLGFMRRASSAARMSVRAGATAMRSVRVRSGIALQ